MKQTKKVDLLTQGKEYWQLVLRRKWMVLAGAVLLSATAVVSIMLLPNWYSSSITVSVDPQKMPDRYVSSTVMADQLRFDNLAEQVLSTPRLQQIIDQLHLYPDLRACMTQQEVIDYMRKNIVVTVKQGGDRNLSAFTIKFSDKNRQIVAKVATALADSFIEWDLGMREHQAVGATKFLASQVEDARAELDEQQEKVNNFRRQHLGELPEQAPSNSATLARLQVALQANIDNLNRLEQEKILLAEGSGQGRSEAPAPTHNERSQLEEQQRRLSEQLADLRSRYSDEYPDVALISDRLAVVQQQLAKLSTKAPVAPQEPASTESKSTNNARVLVTNNEITRLHSEQQEILAQVKEYQAKVEAAPLLEQRLDDLSRDYRSSSVRYQSLLDKSLTAEMAEELERTHNTDRFSIIEPAQVPEKPFKPHRMRWVLLAVPFSFFLPAFLVVFIEVGLRGTISAERDLKAILPLSIPIVGHIPEIDTPSNTNRQRRLAAVAITGSIFCYMGVALFLWRLYHPA